MSYSYLVTKICWFLRLIASSSPGPRDPTVSLYSLFWLSLFVFGSLQVFHNFFHAQLDLKKCAGGMLERISRCFIVGRLLEFLVFLVFLETEITHQNHTFLGLTFSPPPNGISTRAKTCLFKSCAKQCLVHNWYMTYLKELILIMLMWNWKCNSVLSSRE